MQASSGNPVYDAESSQQKAWNEKLPLMRENYEKTRYCENCGVFFREDGGAAVPATATALTALLQKAA